MDNSSSNQIRDKGSSDKTSSSIVKPVTTKKNQKATSKTVGRTSKRAPRERKLDTLSLQKELDRFWKRKIKYQGREKSNELIGKLYEQYVGCLYEDNGWEVKYNGMDEGREDLGRDM